VSIVYDDFDEPGGILRAYHWPYGSLDVHLRFPRVVPAPHWDGAYEPGDGGPDIPFYRCDGRLVCWDCWREYSDHPRDPREECLTVLCNGWRVKL
jgi:hypothetical protein